MASAENNSTTEQKLEENQVALDSTLIGQDSSTGASRKLSVANSTANSSGEGAPEPAAAENGGESSQKADELPPAISAAEVHTAESAVSEDTPPAQEPSNDVNANESKEKEAKEENAIPEVTQDATSAAGESVFEETARETKQDEPRTQSAVGTPPIYDYPKDVTFGCLIFSTAGNGDLFIRWTTEPLPGSLALFMTKKRIPPFKFKTQSDLMTNIDHNRKKFVTGLAAFFKETDAYDGTFQILDNSDHGFGDVWVSIGGKKWGTEPAVPKKVQLGEFVDISTIEAVAIIPRSSGVFDGLLKIDYMRFLNTGTREGAVWHRS